MTDLDSKQRQIKLTPQFVRDYQKLEAERAKWQTEGGGGDSKRFAALEAELTDLRTANGNLTQTNQQLSAANATITADLEAVRRELANSELELAAAQRELDKQRVMLSGLQEKPTGTSSIQPCTTCDDLRSQVAWKQSEIDRLNVTIQQNSSEEMQSQIDEMQSEIDRLNAQIKQSPSGDTRTQLDKLNAELFKVKQDRDGWRKLATELEGRLDQLES